MAELEYIPEPDLADVESIAGDERIRVIYSDSDSGTQVSACAPLELLADYLTNSHAVEELNNFATLADQTGVEKTILNALNSLVGHFEIRTYTGTTSSTGLLSNVSFPMTDIFLGAVVTGGAYPIRCYPYSVSATSQTLRFTNNVSTVIKSKSVTAKCLFFKTTV